MNLAVFCRQWRHSFVSLHDRELLTISDKIYCLICSVQSFIDPGKLIKHPFHIPAPRIHHLSQEQQVPLRNL